MALRIQIFSCTEDGEGFAIYTLLCAIYGVYTPRPSRKWRTIGAKSVVQQIATQPQTTGD